MEHPQIYLITPPSFELGTFPDRLARVIDGQAIACVRMALAAADETDIARAADTLRPICHARDIPLVIDSHFRLVERLGLDGVHLPDGGRNLRAIRKDLGADAIIGAHCGSSRHSGLSAGEAGADYICFGPVSGSALGDGSVAGHDLFRWWSEMIELPVVAEGGLTPDLVESLAPAVDFFGIGAEIWSADDPLAALGTLTGALS